MRQFLLYSNIHIPILAASLLVSTTVILQIPRSWPLVLIASAGAFLIYQIDRIWLYSPEDAINQPDRVRWYKKNQAINRVLSAVAAGASLIALFWISKHTLLICLGVGLAGLVYLIPMGPTSFRIKGVWFGKPLIITLCWGFGAVILPVLDAGIPIDENVFTFFLYRILLVLSNVILADLPDREGDLASGLKTMAVLFSRKRLVKLALFFAAASASLGLMYGIILLREPILFVDLIGACLMMCVAIHAYSEQTTATQFTYGYVPDLIIAWPAVTVIVYYLFYLGGRC